MSSFVSSCPLLSSLSVLHWKICWFMPEKEKHFINDKSILKNLLRMNKKKLFSTCKCFVDLATVIKRTPTISITKWAHDVQLFLYAFFHILYARFVESGYGMETVKLRPWIRLRNSYIFKKSQNCSQKMKKKNENVFKRLMLLLIKSCRLLLKLGILHGGLRKFR